MTLSQFSEQLNKVHSASQELIKKSNLHAENLIRHGKYKEATDTLHNLLDGIEAKNSIVNTAKQQHALHIKQIADLGSQKPVTKNAELLLPKGISKGKIAAIAAGVAVIGGGIYLYHQHQQKKRDSWVQRIEREQLVSPQHGRSF